MKFLLLSTIFLTSLSFSQTKIGENLTISFPIDPEITSETESNRVITDYIAETDSEYYFVEEFRFINTRDDIRSLSVQRRLCLEFFESVLIQFHLENFALTDTQFVDFRGRLAFEFEFENTIDGLANHTKLMVIGDEFYAIGFTGPLNDTRKRNIFFESMVINPDADKRWDDFMKSTSSKIIAITITIILICALVMLFRYQAKKHKEAEKIRLD